MIKPNNKTRIILFIIFLLQFEFSFSQSHSKEVKFSNEIENGIAEGSIPPSRAGTLYSLIGDYYISSTYSDISVSWGVDTLNLDSLELTDALPKIIEKAKNHQIVIISENHLKPQHRIFAKQIIEELSNYGFKHLGLETFSSIDNINQLLDSELSNRGYPLDSPLTGRYTMESRMGNLVRAAIKNKYNLFAYERSKKIKGKDRDENQAENITRYLKDHPDEKMIILCGFHHAIESDLLKYGKFKWMAKHLKDINGIDPLTIYQDNFTEKFIENEHPILQKLQITKPSVFIDKSDRIVAITENVDIEIVHPKTNFHYGRPHWLYENIGYKSVKISKEIGNLKYPIIASAFLIDEINAVPMDRIELKHKYDSKRLVLKSGKYRINLNDGQSEMNYEIVVD